VSALRQALRALDAETSRRAIGSKRRKEAERRHGIKIFHVRRLTAHAMQPDVLAYPYYEGK
jgi:hypothetical protein